MKLKSLLLMATALTRKMYDGPILKASYDKADEIPAGYEALFTQRGEKFELTGIAGVKTDGDVSRVSEALRKERSDHTALKAKVRGTFGENANLDEIRTQLDSIPDLQAQIEAAANPKDTTKIEQLVEARLRQRLAPVERERDQLKAQVTTLTGEVDNFKGIESTRGIHDELRAAGTKLKVLPGALDDILAAHSGIFEKDEAGNVVTKDVPGVTPGISAEVWLTDMQSKKAHWWPSSNGGGAGGGPRGGLPNGKNPWSGKDWNLTEQGKIFKENPERAKQFAGLAGVPVTGGKRPAAK